MFETAEYRAGIDNDEFMMVVVMMIVMMVLMMIMTYYDDSELMTKILRGIMVNFLCLWTPKRQAAHCFILGETRMIGLIHSRTDLLIWNS